MMIRKICPTCEDLDCDVRTNILCPIPECGKILAQSGALRFHLVKVHRIIKNEEDQQFAQHKKAVKQHDDIVTQYHCPVVACVYSIDNGRHFSSLKYLRMHYIKCHGVRHYVCCRCSVKFALRADLARHMRVCGQMYSCVQCGVQYSTAASLAAHCIHTQHTDRPVHARGTNAAYNVDECKGETRLSNYQCMTILPAVSSVNNCEPTSNTVICASSRPLLPRPNVAVIPVNIAMTTQGYIAASCYQVMLIADLAKPGNALATRRTVPIYPKPSPLSTTAIQTDASSSLCQCMMISTRNDATAEPMSAQSPSSVSVATQTIQRRKRTAAETQTTEFGSVRKSTRVSLSSTACQVSPRSAQLGRVCSVDLASSHTQTLATGRSIHHRRNRQTGLVTAATVDVLKPGTSHDDLLSTACADFWLPNFSHNETQTIDWLEQLQASFGNIECVSTQTSLFDDTMPDALHSTLHSSVHEQFGLTTSMLDSSMSLDDSPGILHHNVCTHLNDRLRTAITTHPILDAVLNNSILDGALSTNIFDTDLLPESANLAAKGDVFNENVQCGQHLSSFGAEKTLSSVMHNYTDDCGFVPVVSPAAGDMVLDQLDYDGSGSISMQTQANQCELESYLCSAASQTGMLTETETQTMDDDLQCLVDDVLTHMQTQTTDEDLFSDLGFNDIETQTAVWDVPLAAPDDIGRIWRVTSTASVHTQTGTSEKPLIYN